ncbi:acetate/propionate family kinase [Ammoniphilus sp. YIM 78166]|uniref:acetate/propionate family kinase n=1 Tax=Ammoniphilus sp. YIM 78166 TaxID=1644106 RepID=UPI00106F214F
MKVPVGISNRHIHLSREHVEELFGRGYELKKLKDLQQPGQFACEETVTIEGPKGRIHHVRILGPERKQSQLEISKTDSYILGIQPPVRDSGDLQGTPGIILEGPKGRVVLEEGVILPVRHIHMDEEDARKIGVKDKDIVSVKTKGERAVILENVLCRVNKNYVLEFHVDTDEGNAANLKNGDLVEIIEVDACRELRVMSPKTILLFNCGSSSIKYKLYEMPSKVIRESGTIERVTQEDYGQHFQSIADAMKPYTIDAIAHRVVHGGEEFAHSVVITDETKEVIQKLSPLAPLHNPVNLLGIEWAEKLFPGLPQVAVFDTAFHQTMPPSSYIYPIPYEYYQNHKIRKYGFHGSSHRYVMERAEEMMEIPKEKLRLISCHIGNGVSVTAIRYGRSYDTSMGMTPLAGVSMGTRSGNIDPGIVPYLADIEQTDVHGAIEILNKNSGLLGISGVSNDIREILKGAEEGNERCRLAIDIFTTKLHTFIGLYLARLNGVDGIIFTAGIGENSAEIRERICTGLEYAGVYLDPEANMKRGERFINSRFSPVKVMVIPTNEELIMARDAYQLIL